MYLLSSIVPIGILDMWNQADLFTALIVVILMGMSLLCWTVFIAKLMTIYVKVYQLRVFLLRIKSQDEFKHFLSVAERYATTLPGRYVSENLHYIKQLTRIDKDTWEPITAEQWSFIREHMGYLVEVFIDHEDSYTVILSLSGTTAPLLGLLGTVWGLIQTFIAFQGVSHQGFHLLIPGVMAALGTTLVGLIVALPAVMMYVVLQRKLLILERLLWALYDLILARLYNV
ncbi:MAG: MotA/TolQ/ExbB proton channel family protein, partial [Candidatus Babeliales bacterium]